jgi:hypothetical protein
MAFFDVLLQQETISVFDPVSAGGSRPICIKLRPLSWWDLRFPSLGALLEAL